MLEENSGSVRLEKQPIFYCEKYALKPDTEEEDKIKISTFDDDSNIREVLRDLEGKIIGKRLLFSDVSPQNPSVKKWINHLMENYPALREDTVEDLINTFREALYSRSKEKFRIIVGIFLLKDAVLLIHSKKDPAIAEFEGTINSVKLILHPKNILRVAIIKEENGTVFFSAFEYSKKWSRGHAEFWKIDPEDVSWDSLGNIILRIEVEGFDHGMQMQIESEDLDAMIKDDRISPSGNIKIGKSEGKIVLVDVFRKTLDFNEFYDFYITQQENLEEHRKKFRELIQPGAIQSFDVKSKTKHKFKDYEEKVFEITSTGEQLIHQKNHPMYTICFFSDVYPRIVPSKSLISKLYDAIFENHRFDIWHAGEETSRSQYTIGALNIFNNCKVSREFNELSQKFLNVISDVAGKKEKYLLQFQFCQFWKANLMNEHLNSMFDFISEDRLIPELKFEFKNDGLFTKENQLEFKSASEFNGKIAKFTKDTLLPTIDKYIDEDGLLTRNCILYGVEDDNSINPILHLGSDMIPKIEELSNPSLKPKNIQIKAFPIPVNSGIILLILLLPILPK
ncbi:MAG: hypothetical protein WC586_05015 [Methanoregula sp.]